MTSVFSWQNSVSLCPASFHIPRPNCLFLQVFPANLENSAVATGLEKVNFHSNPKERQCKECSNHGTIALISHARKVTLKLLQARLQQYMNREPPDVQAGFRKSRVTRDHIDNIHWIIGKAREFQKTGTSASLTMPKL